MPEIEEIYLKYFNSVFQYIRQLSGGDETIAEDITSETFFKAMRSLDHFRGDCDVRVWLFQIAKNCYYSYRKRQNKALCVNAEGLETYPSEELPLDEQVIRQESAHRIQKISQSLHSPYKEVFMWRVLGDLSFKEIGSLFNKSENWACVTYHRAKTMIRKRMERGQR